MRTRGGREEKKHKNIYGNIWNFSTEPNQIQIAPPRSRWKIAISLSVIPEMRHPIFLNTSHQIRVQAKNTSEWIIRKVFVCIHHDATREWLVKVDSFKWLFSIKCWMAKIQWKCFSAPNGGETWNKKERKIQLKSQIDVLSWFGNKEK